MKCACFLLKRPLILNFDSFIFTVFAQLIYLLTREPLMHCHSLYEDLLLILNIQTNQKHRFPEFGGKIFVNKCLFVFVCFNSLQLTITSQHQRHHRFCLRMLFKHPDNHALCVLCGHNAMVSGSFKHALGTRTRID